MKPRPKNYNSRKGAKAAKEGVFGDWLLFCIVKSCLSPWFEKEAPDGDRQLFRGQSSLSPTCSWRPFGFAQDMLGAINFLVVVVYNISNGRT
jgi:hypothetical protein